MKATLLTSTLALALAAFPVFAQQQTDPPSPAAAVLPALDSTTAPATRTVRVRGNRSRVSAGIGAAAGIVAGAMIGAQTYAGKPRSPGACYRSDLLGDFCTRPLVGTLETFDGAIRGGAIGGLVGAIGGALIGRAIPAWRDRVALTPLGSVSVRF